MNPPPLLIVVTGMPASGKTTLARELARRLDLPLVEKDEIKEALFDALGTGDVEWSRRLGVAVYELIFVFVRHVLETGQPVIAEANFIRGDQEARFTELPPHRVMQIHCDAPLHALLERYRTRPARHPGHLDESRAEELTERYNSSRHGPLGLEGDLIELDTAGPVDADGLAARIRSAL